MSTITAEHIGAEMEVATVEEMEAATVEGMVEEGVIRRN